MLRQIRDNELDKLPLHDAEIHSLNTAYADDGKINLSIRIKINSEEIDTLLNKFEINESILELTFISCWQIISDIVGCNASREVLLDWSVLQTSSLIDDLKNKGFANEAELKHYLLSLSGGTTLSIIAEKLFISGINK
jgi:hypothetical protein